MIHHLENYYYLFLDLDFNKSIIPEQNIELEIKLELQGFTGLLFYSYRPIDKKLKFDILNNPSDGIHSLDKLSFDLSKKSGNSYDFIIVPFGHFKNENRLKILIKCSKVQINYKLHAWTPSNLFKNVKSVIKIQNKYLELKPIEHDDNQYHLESWFKANDSKLIFDLINSLSYIEGKEDIEISVSDIKSVISKTNEFLFDISKKSQKLEELISIERRDIIDELKTLKGNVKTLSKKKILICIDDIITKYSEKFS